MQPPPNQNKATPNPFWQGYGDSLSAGSRGLLVEPTPVRQAAQEGEVWPAATLAPSLSAFEADVAAQLAPMLWIERSQLRSDWHRLCRLLDHRRISCHQP